MMTSSRGQRLWGGEASSEGFSLLELLVAMGVFLLVSSVSFTLFSRHQALLSEEQTTVGLNIGLRNALAQIQLDVVNAGNGLILGTNVPAWPVGVTIQNSNPTTAQCDPTASNPTRLCRACFDQLNVILADPRHHPSPLVSRADAPSSRVQATPFTVSLLLRSRPPRSPGIFIVVTRSFL